MNEEDRARLEEFRPLFCAASELGSPSKLHH
jgi:hypothetical protein